MPAPATAAADHENSVAVAPLPAPVPRLSEDLLLSSRGLPHLRAVCTRLRFEKLPPGRPPALSGVPVRNLRKLLAFYKTWAHSLHPRYPFKRFVERAGRLCRTRHLQVYHRGWRSALSAAPPSLEQREAEDIAGSAFAQSVDAFDTHVVESDQGQLPDASDLLPQKETALASFSSNEPPRVTPMPPPRTLLSASHSDHPGDDEFFDEFGYGDDFDALMDFGEDEDPEPEPELEPEREKKLLNGAAGVLAVEKPTTSAMRQSGASFGDFLLDDFNTGTQVIEEGPSFEAQRSPYSIGIPTSLRADAEARLNELRRRIEQNVPPTV